MSALEPVAESRAESAARIAEVPRRLVVPALIALLVAAVVLLAIVRSSESAWRLLGVGHGLVPPEYYPVSGFSIVFATAVGQAVGWAAGSALLYHVATLTGFPRGLGLWKVAMSVVYLGLGTLPLFVYHVLFGAPLLGLPQPALEAWLAQRYPDAHWLLFRAHPFVDGAVIPLGIVFLGALWFTGTAPRRSRIVQTLLALVLVGTSLAVALSLAVHSTLVHIRLLD